MSLVATTISQINTAASTTVLVLLFSSFIPGAIGLIFNAIIFTRSSLRHQPCALYFLSSTCFNLFVIFVILPVRILSFGFNIDMAIYNVGICKIEYFSFYAIRSTSCWLIALACIDRYLHSSIDVTIRRMSSLKTAKLSIGITSIIIPMLYSHMLGYLNIIYSSNQSGNIVSTCNFDNIIYRTFIAFWHLALNSLCPSFLMLVFGCLTLNNLRKRRQIIIPAVEHNRSNRRTDRQLVRMLIVQVLMIVICNSPYSIYQLYASFTANLVKDSLRIAQENFASKIMSAMSYFAHSSSFYLYTLTGAIFRKEFFKIIRQCWYSDRNITVTNRNETHQMSVLQKSRKNEL